MTEWIMVVYTVIKSGIESFKELWGEKETFLKNQ